MRKTWVTVLALILCITIAQPRIVIQPLSLFTWLVWGTDDITTHYITESSVSWLYGLKCFLFDQHEILYGPLEYKKPTEPTTIMPSQFSYEFVRESLREPVLIPGLFNKALAISKWKDIQYLNRTIGANVCPVVLTNANHFEIARVSNSYSQILSALTNNPASSLYVSGDQFIFTSNSGKQLLNDLEFEKYLGKKYIDSDLYSEEDLYLFLGNKGKSGTSWHCAPNWSLFVQVVGRKRWTFIHPKYSLLLRPQRSHLYSRIFLASDHFRQFRDQSEKNSGCTNCTVKSDGELFSHVPRSQVILGPGDVVTVPSWYWHHVENLENEEIDAKEGKMIIGLDVDTHVWNHAWLWALFPQL